MAFVNLKQFHFQVEINGVTVGLTTQDFKPPEKTYAAVKHNESGKEIKTAGISSVEDFDMEIMLGNFTDTEYFNTWFKSIPTLPDVAYKREMRVFAYTPDFQVKYIAILTGVYPCAINTSEFKAGGTENVMYKIKFCADDKVDIHT